MLFIGFPVELTEAYRILGVDVVIKEENYDYGEELSEYLQPFGLGVFYIDAGVCVLGRKLDDALGKKYNPVSHFTDSIWRESTDVLAKLKDAGANLSRIRICHMYEESKTVMDAKPMVMLF